MRRILAVSLLLVLSRCAVQSQTLQLPPRPADAPGGTAVAQTVTPLTLANREIEIYRQAASGNVPDFLRTLVPDTIVTNIGGINHTAILYVLPDYFAIGSNDDYLLMPMTPTLAQYIANLTSCSLPTRKIVDAIYKSAVVKLAPYPLPPIDSMTMVPYFLRHSNIVRGQRDSQIVDHPLGALVGGDKKDVVITNKINNPTPTGKVAIYGWHQLNGTPIQPLYTGHADTWADYSHGIRLVQQAMTLDGNPTTVETLLRDAALCGVISDEGVVNVSRYPVSPFAPSTVVPATPKTFGVIPHDSASVRILLTRESDTTTYKAFYGFDGVTFPDSVTLSGPDLLITGLPGDSVCYIRLRAYSSAAWSGFSEVLSAIPRNDPARALIVNGFDRASAGNTYNFVRQHGSALHANGVVFGSATNEAVRTGLLPMAGYRIVDWILGDESTVDETFSTAEQETVKTYLRSGGSLLVSGSEIGWDLDYKGSSADKAFYNQFLKAQYLADAPNGTASTYYSATPLAGSLFDGLGAFSFDNGTHGTINVSYPDAVNAVNGGAPCLQYTGVSSGYAAVSFIGLFPSGSAEGHVVTMGVPFETIYPDSTRNVLMEKIVAFFNTVTDVSPRPAGTPAAFSLDQNFPNPFNPSTRIRFSVNGAQRQAVLLRVFDLAGRMVATLVDGEFGPGVHSVEFRADGLASGVYYYRLDAGGRSDTKRMMLLR